jgi:hypothetical protein
MTIPYGADYDDEGSRLDAVDAYDLVHGDPDVPWPGFPTLTPKEDKIRQPENRLLARENNGSDTSNAHVQGDDRLLAGVRDGTWLDRQEFPALQFAIEGLVPEGLAPADRTAEGWQVLAGP